MIKKLVDWWNRTEPGNIYPNNFGVYNILVLVLGVALCYFGILWVLHHVRVI